MIRSLIFISALISLTPAGAQDTKTYVSVFVPHMVTYNGSDNPNECWESVAAGVLIRDGQHHYFFALPDMVMESLQQTAGGTEFIFEVVFYEEAFDQSGLDGSVTRILLDGVEIYSDL